MKYREERKLQNVGLDNLSIAYYKYIVSTLKSAPCNIPAFQ